MLKTLDLQTADDSRDIVHRTVQALVEGQVVGVPTETTYALAANALSESAVSRLYEITSASEKLCTMEVSIRSREAAGDFISSGSSTARRLIYRCWPGPMTLCVKDEPSCSALSQLPPSVRSLVVGENQSVGYRVVDHDILDHIHRYLSAPLVLATCGGATGDDIASDADFLAQHFRESMPLLLDDGPTRYGGVTTVVHVDGNRWKLLREGVIERAAMNQFVKPVIALVCTGNTCRSPMAETLLREQLRKHTGCEDAVRVLSAGVAAGCGAGASPQAVAVMGKRGLDLTGHSSRPLDESVMHVADLVLTMTRGHRAAILAAWPDMHDRVFTLRRDGGDIADPVGMAVEVYQACADQIDCELEKWMDSLEDDFFPRNESNR
ncbi:arsenate reductase/protein-tyrosine-phosphatase family protein [Novipirellula artificiosorum]|uniref:L-threonylcarbamoyladenylate synthase n=1 Tax=Novipirellula artificiosorum TaxID=2528016 RepID=A0A5C6DPG0_9BACT|nr:Sua5/YciO/YrdC/YwlC family protein [Novipirellula artificiosorum]TWU39183.1 Low molecular weight protein-tyrosine-phosphatase YwlE [Novipirellula artificiosorum]